MNVYDLIFSMFNPSQLFSFIIVPIGSYLPKIILLMFLEALEKFLMGWCQGGKKYFASWEPHFLDQYFARDSMIHGPAWALLPSSPPAPTPAKLGAEIALLSN